MTTYIQAIGLGFPAVQASSAGTGATYEDIVWEAGAPLPSKETLDSWIASQSTVSERKVTRLAFRNRFTKAEKVGLELASLDNPAATPASRQLSAALRVDMRDTESATFIDLERADTRAGVQMLEQYGLIGVGRAATILDAPIQEAELPR